MNIIYRIIKSYQDSNHDQHFMTGWFLAIYGTILLSICFGIIKEKYDKSIGGIYDKSDICWTIVGGLFGQVLQIILVVLILKML